jgi:hypothetical protein
MKPIENEEKDDQNSDSKNELGKNQMVLCIRIFLGTELHF